MTKTLTEQWRDGEWIVCNAGKCDYYYTDVKCYNGSHKEVIKEESVFLTDYDPDYEILGEVPSYEEYKRLQEQLKEANVVIKWYDGLEKMLIGWELCTGQKKGTAEKYLKKWGVK